MKGLEECREARDLCGRREESLRKVEIKLVLGME